MTYLFGIDSRFINVNYLIEELILKVKDIDFGDYDNDFKQRFKEVSVDFILEAHKLHNLEFDIKEKDLFKEDMELNGLPEFEDILLPLLLSLLDNGSKTPTPLRKDLLMKLKEVCLSSTQENNKKVLN